MNNRLSTVALAPLVVDLDGTLTPTDTLWESLVRLVRQRPTCVFLLPFWLLSGRAGFKSRVASQLRWSGQNVPLHEPLLAYLREQKALGRRIVLCTAADERIARTVAAGMDVFDDVIASDGTNNLKGERKLQAIRERIDEPFVYAGDSEADLSVWAGAAGAIVVGGSERFRHRVEQATAAERHFDAYPGRSPKVWLKTVRAHQWLKNVLVFVPLLTSFTIGQTHRIALAAMAFAAFSLAASATYIVNDLWDLDSDRAHPRKRARPLASGAVTIASALALALVMITTAYVVSAWVGARFVLLLSAYVVLTSSYSWILKRVVVADVLTLASLYTLRVLAGAVAIDVPVSSWLLAFSGFVFFGLALVKRCAELVSLEQLGRPGATGRDYRVADLRVLWPMGVGASLCAVVVFGLFIHSPDTTARYATPSLIWVAALGLMYWLTRLWIKTSRGEMHDDPLVFALKDANSRVTIAFICAGVIFAHFVHLDL